MVMRIHHETDGRGTTASIEGSDPLAAFIVDNVLAGYPEPLGETFANRHGQQWYQHLLAFVGGVLASQEGR